MFSVLTKVARRILLQRIAAYVSQSILVLYRTPYFHIRLCIHVGLDRALKSFFFFFNVEDPDKLSVMLPQKK